jgi:colanic acid/amylovoran biosynthesis glycosyltransferase
MKALMLLRNSRSLKVLLKNLAVYSKGLWLARLAREWKATHIHAHWSAATSTIALIAGEAAGIPWSFTAHRFDIAENNLLSLKIKKASLARFISESGLEMARSLDVGEVLEKARVIHMGVDMPSSPPEYSHQNDPPTILCPANLLPVKGHRYLIDAVAILKQREKRVQLWIAGQGELREELERQVETAGLVSDVRWLGQLSHSDLLRLYEEGRVGMVVLPSMKEFPLR